MVVVFVISVWIRRLRPVFPLSQVELCLAVRERWRTAANFDRRSHCPGYHVDFFTFAEHVSFEHSTGSPWPVIYSGREGNINKQTHKTQKFLCTRSSIRQSASPCMPLCSGAAASARSGAGAATFRSNRKYRYRRHTQLDVGNCWPCSDLPGIAHSTFASFIQKPVHCKVSREPP